MKFSLLLAIISIIIISSSLTSCGMKRALYLPEKEEVKKVEEQKK